MWAAPVVDAIIHTDTQLSMLQILHYEGIERDRSEFVLEGGSIHVDGEGCASLNCSVDWSMSAPNKELVCRQHLGVNCLFVNTR